MGLMEAIVSTSKQHGTHLHQNAQPDNVGERLRNPAFHNEVNVTARPVNALSNKPHQSSDLKVQYIQDDHNYTTPFDPAAMQN
ncbi:hypothetical protein NPIL_281651 [Nephila pilipes]|uniref:Uncharacterized protein n=1 Tax=Nephila pilipes TaxID=299642 RepID=A0A8X6PAI2_NEPPI|nr:hypothetical protein NPIL_281651 [Nephila pilipes]